MLLVVPILAIWALFLGFDAQAEDIFTINVKWKCISPSVMENYPCRSSNETINSFPGGVVYLHNSGVHCDNASISAPNAFKLAIGKRSSGKILCKKATYDGIIDYKGTIKRTGDGLSVDLSGTFNVKWGAGMKQNTQSLAFTYAAKFKVEGSKCFGTKSWRFSGKMNSIPTASGRYTYSVSGCAIKK